MRTKLSDSAGPWGDGWSLGTLLGSGSGWVAVRGGVCVCEVHCVALRSASCNFPFPYLLCLQTRDVYLLLKLVDSSRALLRLSTCSYLAFAGVCLGRAENACERVKRKAGDET